MQACPGYKGVSREILNTYATSGANETIKRFFKF